MTAIFCCCLFPSPFPPSKNRIKIHFDTCAHTERNLLSKCCLPQCEWNKRVQGTEKERRREKKIVFLHIARGRLCKNHERLNSVPPLFRKRVGCYSSRVDRRFQQKKRNLVVLTENSHLGWPVPRFIWQRYTKPKKIGIESSSNWLALKRTKESSTSWGGLRRKNWRRRKENWKRRIPDATPATPSTSFNSSILRLSVSYSLFFLCLVGLSEFLKLLFFLSFSCLIFMSRLFGGRGEKEKKEVQVRDI